jgi:hypothetical protein
MKMNQRAAALSCEGAGRPTAVDAILLVVLEARQVGGEHALLGAAVV